MTMVAMFSRMVRELWIVRELKVNSNCKHFPAKTLTVRDLCVIRSEFYICLFAGCDRRD